MKAAKRQNTDSISVLNPQCDHIAHYTGKYNVTCKPDRRRCLIACRYSFAYCWCGNHPVFTIAAQPRQSHGQHQPKVLLITDRQYPFPVLISLLAGESVRMLILILTVLIIILSTIILYRMRNINASAVNLGR